MIERRYLDPRPNTGIGRMRTELMKLLDEHKRDGALPTSIRFLFYECIARKIIAKSGDRKRQDTLVSEPLTDLRDRGHIPWDWLVDETRTLHSFTGSETVAEDLLDWLHSARLDPWDGEVPLILTESRSLAGVLRDLASRYRVRIASTNGYAAGFLYNKIGPALTVGGRVLYLGDFDWVGNDIERHTRDTLEDIIGASLDWERLALTEEQVTEHNLTVIIKKDKRFNDGKPHEAVETEALSQSLIVNIVRSRLDELLPQPLEAIHDREVEERARLRRLIQKEMK